ncbi:MAG: CapA family protein [Melioribacteraceae bacterium]|nr:CapA family protein [Melioribacteraceae bacterium]MCF8264550.1 CapA family protein [Melioribacteraceae bacterium]MCF8432586.1 CapA family protein [Melioribacteraceae bacterium]
MQIPQIQKFFYFIALIVLLIPSKYLSQTDSTVSFTISAVGDLMCHSTQFKYAKVDTDKYDFGKVFSSIAPYLSQSDVTIGNIETVFAGRDKGIAGYPVFNTPDEYLDALKDAGFDVLVTANNHSLDMDVEGLLRTNNLIREKKMEPVGTFVSEADRDSVRIYEYNGLKVGITSYTYATNIRSAPKDSSYLINYIQDSIIKNDIQNLRNAGAELVITFFHFGTEYERYPSGYQKRVVQNTISYGADIILGCHPHVVQPFEYFQSEESNIDRGFVAYSLGNFVSNQRWQYSDGGVIVNIEVEKLIPDNSLKLKNVSFVPVWVYKGVVNYDAEYFILPSRISETGSFPSYFTDEDKALMKQSYFDTREIINSDSLTTFNELTILPSTD